MILTFSINTKNSCFSYYHFCHIKKLICNLHKFVFTEILRTEFTCIIYFDFVLKDSSSNFCAICYAPILLAWYYRIVHISISRVGSIPLRLFKWILQFESLELILSTQSNIVFLSLIALLCTILTKDLSYISPFTKKTGHIKRFGVLNSP